MESSFVIFGSNDGKDIDLIVFESYEKKHLGLLRCKEIEKKLQTMYPTKELDPMLGTVENGVIVKTLKGAPDEVNNSIYCTYKYHDQKFALPITHLLERNIPQAICRATRHILSAFSRCSIILEKRTTKKGKKINITVRNIVKDALKKNILGERLQCLSIMKIDTYLKLLIF